MLYLNYNLMVSCIDQYAVFTIFALPMDRIILLQRTVTVTLSFTFHISFIPTMSCVIMESNNDSLAGCFMPFMQLSSQRAYRRAMVQCSLSLTWGISRQHLM